MAPELQSMNINDFRDANHKPRGLMGRNPQLPPQIAGPQVPFAPPPSFGFFHLVEFVFFKLPEAEVIRSLQSLQVPVVPSPTVEFTSSPSNIFQHLHGHAMEPATASASAWLTVLGLSGEAVVGAEQRPLVQIPMEPSHSVKQIKGWIGSKDIVRVGLPHFWGQF
jgi:hypothetical protein